LETREEKRRREFLQFIGILSGQEKGYIRSQIRKRYLKGLLKIHPDRMIGVSPQQKKRNEERLKQFNQYYQENYKS
jgi:preprotein translocase subunit Sec63